MPDLHVSVAPRIEGQHEDGCPCTRCVPPVGDDARRNYAWCLGCDRVVQYDAMKWSLLGLFVCYQCAGPGSSPALWESHW